MSFSWRQRQLRRPLVSTVKKAVGSVLRLRQSTWSAVLTLVSHPRGGTTGGGGGVEQEEGDKAGINLSQNTEREKEGEKPSRQL